jgi:hypothetical protein
MLHNLYCSPSAVPSFFPQHFAVQIFLSGLQQVASIHVLLSHCDTCGSRHLFITFVPSHVGHSPSHPTPYLHILDCLSWCTWYTTHAVPDICSSTCLFAFWKLFSPSCNFHAHHCLLFSMILGCTAHAVPSLRPLAFLQLDRTPPSTPVFILRGPAGSSAGALMLQVCLPPPSTTLTFNFLPPTQLEFSLWVVTAWVSPSPLGRVPRRVRPWPDVSWIM